jgi:hypothetical protein
MQRGDAAQKRGDEQKICTSVTQSSLIFVAVKKLSEIITTIFWPAMALANWTAAAGGRSIGKFHI